MDRKSHNVVLHFYTYVSETTLGKLESLRYQNN